MDNNLKLHFCLKYSRKNSNGRIPIYLRLILDGKRTEIATGKSILSDNWNKYYERARGNREEARILNNYLDTLSNKVTKHYNELLCNEEDFDINDLRNYLKGNANVRKTLIQIHEENNILMKKEEGIKYVKKTVS